MIQNKKIEKGSWFESLFALLVFGLALLVFVPGWNSFAFPPASKYSDFLISHYPNYLWIKNSLIKDGVFPLWCNSILSGYPFAADPLSGLWYPPSWIMLLVPQPLGFNLQVFVHILIGSWGLYKFLRLFEIQLLPAVAGALIFALAPKTWGHFGAGHISLIFAISWTPWLLYQERKFARRKNKTICNFGRGLIWGIIILADVRWAFYAGIVWIVSSFFFNDVYKRVSYSNGESEKLMAWFSRSLNWGFHFLLQAVVGLALAAPLLIPMAEYAGLSTRSALTWKEVATLSLPPSHLAGIFIPDIGGYFEWMVYPGIAAAMGLVLTLADRTIRRKFGIWLVALPLILLVALGDSTGVISFLFRWLPGMNLLRVPSRVLFLNELVFSVLLAGVLNFLGDDTVSLQKGRWGEMAVGILTFLIGAFCTGLWLLTGQINFEFAWASTGAVSFLILLILRRRAVISKNIWQTGIILLIILDLGMVSTSLVRYQSVQDVVSDQNRPAAYIASQTGLFRVYSPSYSIPQLTGMNYGLELADGIDPLQLRSYAEYFGKASGVPVEGYSVTLPPYRNGNPDTDNRDYRPDPAMLGRLNVRFVASNYDLPIEGLRLRARLGGTRIYENQEYLPRAYLLDSGNNLILGSAPPEWVSRTANSIQIRAHGPGTLVLSEIYYPGWIAYLDGVKTEIRVIDNLFRAVQLPPGDHSVTMVFRPVRVYIGLLFAIVAIVFSVGIWIKEKIVIHHG